LGIAYQIYDDCLDFIGTEEAIGKTLGTDLVRGKLTLPILHFLAECDPQERAEWQEIILHGSTEAHTNLLSQVISRGSLRHAIDRIHHYLRVAEESLMVLPKTNYRLSLQGIAHALTKHIEQIE
jgi:octaprenyl-diphosphate synthase